MEEYVPLSQRTKPCEKCGADCHFNDYCGTWVCDSCGQHQGLARCYCGWSESGVDGRRELEEMGETIEPDDWFNDDNIQGECPL